jgi:hypothetical protein
MFPFNARSKTFKIDVTGTSSTSKAISTSATIRLANLGVNPCYVSIGSGAQTATVPTTTAVSTCDVVPAGGDITLSVQQIGIDLQIAAICGAGLTTTLIVSTGAGI